MKKLLLSIFILFCFQTLSYGQDTLTTTIFTPDVGLFPKSRILGNIGYWVQLKSPNHPQTIALADMGFHLPFSNEKTILNDSSFIGVSSKYVRITAYNSIKIHLTGLSISNIEVELENAYHFYIDSLNAEFLRITDHNSEKSKAIFAINKSRIDTIISFGNFKSFKITDAKMIHQLILDDITVTKNFILKDSKIDTLYLSNATLPDTIELNNLDLTGMTGYIDLTKIQETGKTNKFLLIGKIDFSKLKIPFTKYSIIIDDNGNYEDQITLYQTVINKLKAEGLYERAEVLDKAYQRLKLLHNHQYITYIFSKCWWDFGYDKAKVVTNAFILYFIFFCLNLFLFETISKVYYPPNIEFYIYNKSISKKFNHTNKIKELLYKTPITLLYTAFIFWGLKLDLKELKIKNWWALILIVFEYTIGVICLAYIANYIITK